MWTVRRLSHTVHELMDGLMVVCLSGKRATMDHTGERVLLKHSRSDLAVLLIVSHLNEGGDVGVVCFVHVATIQDLPEKSSDSGRFGDRHTNSVKQCSDFLLNRIC